MRWRFHFTAGLFKRTGAGWVHAALPPRSYSAAFLLRRVLTRTPHSQLALDCFRTRLKSRVYLISRTRSARTLSAARFARVDMASLATALRPSNIREGLLERNVIGVDAVAYQVVELWTG